ncbi:uncharacterized protein STAUR_4196 [Stigmatella aurantiaca DW4/3-1]|uniref:Uncharacterized protein n=1 Tax=Stigmatella aurantiaca (strain DW4/3-1) TaxID=378806 RepID=E3FQU5_STIAD|nr:uncharacterized protein STAUR_4196 [Stigmatella aurantiaca DW4/3-1]
MSRRLVALYLGTYTSPRSPLPRKLEWLVGGGEMAALIASLDWSRPPLGPIEDWPQSLRTTVSLCLASNFPINIIWGDGHNQIYNAGYRVACGAVHPRAMGESYRVTAAVSRRPPSGPDDARERRFSVPHRATGRRALCPHPRGDHERRAPARQLSITRERGP